MALQHRVGGGLFFYNFTSKETLKRAVHTKLHADKQIGEGRSQFFFFEIAINSTT